MLKLSQRENIYKLLSLISILVIWQLLSFLNVVNENLLPSPSKIMISTYKGFINGSLIMDAIQSIRRVLVGYLLGGLFGLILGFLCSINKNISNLLIAPIDIIRPIPPIAWISIAILWFGSGEPSAYFLVSLGSFFPIFTNTLLGISLVQPGTVEVAKCYGASKSLIFKKIIIPQALPSIFSGFQTGLGVSWMIVITAELVGVQSGLGYFIQISRAQLQTEDVISGMLIIGGIGYTLNSLLKFISRRVMPWKYGESSNIK